ncbi:MAG TPA: hypothetical protein VLV87_04935 [Gammaproteobacteria bacterium]|nr:hypothetical protein [Gammaproteobacteria bacterium]
MHVAKSSNDARVSRASRPLTQVEVLLLFHPRLQGGSPGHISLQDCSEATQGWLTLDVYGRRGISELNGRPVMEEMRLETGGEDIEALLPDVIVNEVADYALDDAG